MSEQGCESVVCSQQSEQVLARKIENIFTKVVQECERILAPFPVGPGNESRDNLLAYLALKKYRTDQLERELTESGLTTLELSKPHILYSLRKVLEHLGGKYTNSTHLSSITPADSRNLSTERSERLLGKRHHPRQSTVMVTLDSEMVQQQGVLEKLLINGMNIARINCAHDNKEKWGNMIHALREAEKNLIQQGKYQNRKCKVFMDLAGPKIRIGKFKHEKHPIKLQVKKDFYGKTIRKAVGYLDSKASETKFVKDAGTGYFILAVNDNDLLELVQVGNEIHFTDIRQSKRKLTVVDIVSPTCVKVELHNTAYIDEGTSLYFENKRMEVHSLLSQPVKISVRKGDILRLYLNPNLLGHPATDDEPAGVPVSLVRAFRNVRKNDPIFIDDGKISGKVKEVRVDCIEVEILSPKSERGRIKEEDGLNLPDSFLSLNVPSITEKDIQDLPFVLRYADILGVSFVHSPLDLVKLRKELERFSSPNMAVIAKIETKDSIHQLSRIIFEGLKFRSFGIMIARGDLTIEVGPENMAYVQKEILSICAAAQVPVIWATGVLEKLTKTGIVARSEITDAAVGKLADCIMLNKGTYIIESLKILAALLNIEENLQQRKQPNPEILVEQYL